MNTIVTSPHSTAEMPWVFLVKNPNPGEDANKVIDVAMTMPLGGKRAGLYHFPRVGERVFVMLTGDRAVLMGYVPDKTGSFSDFPEDGDKWARKATSLRYTPPTGEKKADGDYAEVGFSHERDVVEAVEQRIIDGTGCGFCLDIGHAVCSANSQGLEPYAFASDLARRFRPAMFHLSDVTDMTSVHDAHPHLGTGELDIPRICREIFPANAKVSIETVRDSMTDLEDFRRDVDYLGGLL